MSLRGGVRAGRGVGKPKKRTKAGKTMKRGTPDHPKMKGLAKALGIPIYSAVGLMEMLWQFTARYAPQGNVGKFSDEEIAASLGWDGDASRLVATLADKGWLNRDDHYRYIVHDWADHADDTCDKYLAANGLQYADGSPTRRKSRQVATGRDADGINRGEPVPISESEPLSGASEGDSGRSDVFEGVNGTYRDAFRALRATGKMDQLTYEHLAQVAEEFPLAQIHLQKNFRELVLESAGVAGKIGAVMPWLRKAVSSLEERRMVEAQKKDAAGSYDDPRSRRLERATS